MLRRMDLRGEIAPDDLLHRPDPARSEVTDAVRAILEAVKAEGDGAVLRFSERFDGVRPESLRVPAEEVERAPSQIGEDVLDALRAAHESVAAFHRAQLSEPHTHAHNGVLVEGLRVPVARAGVYVPGGRAAYPSTVIMTAVPARVAGVEEVALCVPPGPGGKVTAVTLAAASLSGVDEVYAIGGAQAIAAMAYGTETLRPVDVIAGPGNVYVAIAKREVAGIVGVPSAFAGPSEIVVLADESTPIDAAAIDLMVQAEHGPEGLAWLITWDEKVGERISARVEELVAAAPRRAEIESTLRQGGTCAIVDSPERAMEVSNHIAPEHLQIMCEAPERLVPLVRNAGAVFCGPWSPASIGDYLAGPSHVLPTFGSARYGSALTVDDFQKQIHVITLDRAAFDRVGPWVEALASAEGLEAHASSIRIRRGLEA